MLGAGLKRRRWRYGGDGCDDRGGDAQRWRRGGHGITWIEDVLEVDVTALNAVRSYRLDGCGKSEQYGGAGILMDARAATSLYAVLREKVELFLDRIYLVPCLAARTLLQVAERGAHSPLAAVLRTT